MRNKGLKHRVLVRIPFHVHNESPCEDLEKWTPKWTVSPTFDFSAWQILQNLPGIKNESFDSKKTGDTSKYQRLPMPKHHSNLA